MASVVIAGDVSGTCTLQAANAAGTTVLSLPTTSGTLVSTGGAPSFTTVTTGLGNAAAPSITFTGDTNTGIFSPGADTIAFTEGGTESMRITSTGTVAIGTTTTPTAKLWVESGRVGLTNAYKLGWHSNPAAADLNNYITGDDSTNYVAIGTGAVERMRINSSGNVQLSTAGTSILNSSGNQILNQTGSILQVVSVTKTDTFTTTSGSYVDVTGFSATITPTSTSNKILIIATWHGNNTNGGMSSLWFRNATQLPVSTNTSPVSGTSGMAYNSGGSTVQPMSYSYLDSPSSTSALTYKMQTRSGGGTSYFNISPNNEYGAISTLTLMEIAG